MFTYNLSQHFNLLRIMLSRITQPICRHYYTPRDNPGVYRRLKVLSEDEPNIKQQTISSENMDDLEGDFMNADEVYDEVFKEVKSISKHAELKIIERKYFKSPKEPNMLTWSEKEHIRYIHQTDPEKWSHEALAESFPASPTIIKKILRAKWKPTSIDKLKAHDYRVSENWKAFYSGKLEVHDPKLKAHLAKFTERKNGTTIISDEEAVKITEVKLPRPNKTEFLSLVSDITSEDQELCSAVSNLPQIKQSDNLSALNTVKEARADYTLDQFKKRLSEVDTNSEDPNGIIKLIVKENPSNRSTFQTFVSPSDGFQENASVFKKRIQSNLELKSSDTNPNRITIPLEKRKPGTMYQVKDCFYNDKGYFVYRVPGLQY